MLIAVALHLLFTNIAWLNSIDFKEALEILAKEIGVNYSDYSNNNSEVSKEYHEIKEILNLSKEYFEVSCSHGSLKIYEIQIEGKKRMSSKDFIMGFQNLEGISLG